MAVLQNGCLALPPYLCLRINTRPVSSMALSKQFSKLVMRVPHGLYDCRFDSCWYPLVYCSSFRISTNFNLLSDDSDFLVGKGPLYCSIQYVVKGTFDVYKSPQEYSFYIYYVAEHICSLYGAVSVDLPVRYAC